jgi:hypothetical protein
MIWPLQGTRKDGSVLTITGHMAIGRYVALETQQNIFNSLEKPTKYPDAAWGYHKVCGCMGPHRSGGAEKAGCISDFVRKFLQWFICIVSSGTQLYGAPKFIFATRSRHVLKWPYKYACSLW